MPTIRLRPRAQDDLIEIWTYIAEDDETQADALLGSIDQKLQLLAKRPLIGRERSELHPALRSVPLARYVIFYLPDAEGIEVVRVLHSRRDLGSDILEV
jgi:toxin ParE1/3/4